MIRFIPDFAHLMGAPLQILQGHINMHANEAINPSTALSYANRCVRRGYTGAEMAAFAALMWTARWPRREVHRNFADIVPYLKPANETESAEALEARVEAASDDELNNRSFSDLI